MNRTSIEWVVNPDGSRPGWSWNPITGCLNNCSYCYARKLAHGRLKPRYLANLNIALPHENPEEALADPFYPRFWQGRLNAPLYGNPKGIFVCDMGELFGDWVPYGWINEVFHTINRSPQHRFYLLTKQPQNLAKFSPFPENCFVGVTATGYSLFNKALDYLKGIEARVKFISLEPLLEQIPFYPERLPYCGINWVIIGAQTQPRVLPRAEWVQEIIEACQQAHIPYFLKANLHWPEKREEFPEGAIRKGGK